MGCGAWRFIGPTQKNRNEEKSIHGWNRKSFILTMIKIIFMNLNYKPFLVMMFSENSDNRYLANKEGS